MRIQDNSHDVTWWHAYVKKTLEGRIFRPLRNFCPVILYISLWYTQIPHEVLRPRNFEVYPSIHNTRASRLSILVIRDVKKSTVFVMIAPPALRRWASATIWQICSLFVNGSMPSVATFNMRVNGGKRFFWLGVFISTCVRTWIIYRVNIYRHLHPRTLQTLYNDSLTTVNLVHYINDKGVEVCLTGC